MEAWIETISEEDAQGRLKAHYDAAIERAGRVFNIVKVMSLRPLQLRDSMMFYGNIMKGASGLSRTEREMVAVVTSQVNECFY